jgi:Xaa-Pro aminopeptidase
MFMRPRDPYREIWDGPRAGLESGEIFGAHSTFAFEDVSILPKLLSSSSSIYYDASIDPRIRSFLPNTILSPNIHFQSMRLVKSPSEIALMQRSASIAAAGVTAVSHRPAHTHTHVSMLKSQAMKYVKPGISEIELEAVMEFETKIRGARRLSYPPVIATGTNALILHYISNNDVVKRGDLVLMDAGAEYEGYASDITRTFPATGKFTPAQAQLYETVLRVNKEIIKASSLSFRPNCCSVLESEVPLRTCTESRWSCSRMVSTVSESIPAIIDSSILTRSAIGSEWTRTMCR